MSLSPANLHPGVVPASPPRLVRFVRRTGAVFARAMLAHAGMIVLVGVHVGIALAVSLWIGRTYQSGILGNGAVFMALIAPVVLTALLVWRFIYMAACVRPEHPLRYFWDGLVSDLGDPNRLVQGTLAMTLIIVFIGSFTFLKEAIPHLIPFSWDAFFAAADRALHFGYDPWRILTPAFGVPFLTTIVNFLYHLWYFVMFLVVWAAAFSTRQPKLRLAFLYAFVLTWAIGGNLLAVIFSSAGPVYYERLGLGADFEPLMTSLRQTAETSTVWALAVQEELWKSYAEGGARFGGISAMPSLHVGSAVLFALYGFAISRAFGWILAAFAASIMLGSVYLGWHYAVDGYAGALGGFLCWRVGLRLAGGEHSPTARELSAG